MTSDEIRLTFLDFFRKHQHTLVSSAPLIPADDPTLLFTNAGMNQFKDVFLGMGKRDYKRAVDTQKCMRVSGKHNDLEEVGYSKSHHTFFEMLGNWSFGDYYKREAITFAWELVTDVWKMPKDRLWASVHLEDDEAEDLWYEATDLPAGRVCRFDKDNFWQMGATGPCGPCSELHIDLGEEACPNPDVDHECGVNTCDRYREFWNLVFIQYNRDDKRNLHPLPETHVDTGMGFERVVAILQGEDSNYKTDVFAPLIDTIASITNSAYSDDVEGVPHRVIADHARCLTFAIGDGVMPSNEGRGYVVRRILRRAVVYGKRLGMSTPFLYKIVDKVIDLLGDTFPEVRPRQDFIKKIIQSEEGRFQETLDRGLERFEVSLATMQTQQEKAVLPGERAFELYDTFGFPLDLTQILARERGVSVDETGFEKRMNQQRDRSRADWNAAGGSSSGESIYAEILDESGKSEFVGYERFETESEIVALIQEGELVSSAHEGDEVSVFLNRTPFYGESGGQIGDAGHIEGHRSKLEVIDTLKPATDLVLHKCKVLVGEISVQATVGAEIDGDRRRHVSASHTATHILHAVLRTVLGTHVGQAGSLVQQGRLRFDFTHYGAVAQSVLYDIEELINDKIRLNDKIELAVMPLQQAKDRGALAFFGDKYGEIVRLVEMGDYSKELCGGTHVKATGEIGLVKLISESGVAAGVRRIEALTGLKAHKIVRVQDETLSKLGEMFRIPTHLVENRIQVLVRENRTLQGEIQKLQDKLAASNLEEFVQQAIVVDDIQVVATIVENTSKDRLRHLVDELKVRIESGVIVLASVEADEVSFIAGVTPGLVKDPGLHAGNILQSVVKLADGRGGGRPDLAQGGSKSPIKAKLAIEQVGKIVAEQL